MEYKYTLDILPINKTALITYVNCNDNLKNRLYDLGIIESANITPVFRSPFGDPTAYLVKNSVIALRKNESRNIYVYVQ